MAIKRKHDQLSAKSTASTNIHQHQLDRDDAEIEDLERKLGIKKGKKSGLKGFVEDGLDEFFSISGSNAHGDDIGDADDEESRKQKQEYNEWLAQKRARTASTSSASKKSPDSSSKSVGAWKSKSVLAREKKAEQKRGPTASSSESDEDDFEGFQDSGGSDIESDLDELASGDESPYKDIANDEDDSENDDESTGEEARVRENPYLPPTQGDVVAKYVPPSLRKQSSSQDDEVSARLRRQFQGLLNRLSESNILGILKDVEQIYARHPRGQVTSALVDSLMAQVVNPATLPDTFYVLTAGFSSAVYKIIGESFGSHLITRVVELFQQAYEKADKSGRQNSKEATNLMTFISELYVFQTVGSSLIFDYMRLLLEDINEMSTEVMLRIVRMAGKYIRKDDPQALKEVVGILSTRVTSTDHDVSVRTKFMIETITDLKNNKLKAGVQESAVVADHVTKMRKILGGLATRRLAATGPLRIGLQDIQQASVKGKWWLVGASYADPLKHATTADSLSAGTAASTSQSLKRVEVSDHEGSDSEDYEFWLPEKKLRQLALDLGLKTEIQQNILVAITSSANCDDAIFHFRKLNLNKNHRCEAATVLVACASGEQPYNPFYAVVAKRLASDGRIRYAFKSQLLSLLRRMGESLFQDDDDDGHDGDITGLDEDRLINIGRMYGHLIWDNTLSLDILKGLDFPTIQSKTLILLTSLFSGLFSECRVATKIALKGSKGSSTKEDEKTRLFHEISRVFGSIRGSALGINLIFFMSKLQKASDLFDKKDRACCKQAKQVLEDVDTF